MSVSVCGSFCSSAFALIWVTVELAFTVCVISTPYPALTSLVSCVLRPCAPMSVAPQHHHTHHHHTHIHTPHPQGVPTQAAVLQALIELSPIPTTQLSLLQDFLDVGRIGDAGKKLLKARIMQVCVCVLVGNHQLSEATQLWCAHTGAVVTRRKGCRQVLLFRKSAQAVFVCRPLYTCCAVPCCAVCCRWPSWTPSTGSSTWCSSQRSSQHDQHGMKPGQGPARRVRVVCGVLSQLLAIPCFCCCSSLC